MNNKEREREIVVIIINTFYYIRLLYREGGKGVNRVIFTFDILAFALYSTSFALKAFVEDTRYRSHGSLAGVTGRATTRIVAWVRDSNTPSLLSAL